MDNAALQKYLLRLFARYRVELMPGEDDWLLTQDDYPAIRATGHAQVDAGGGRLDVDVVLDEERCIEESFAGIGCDSGAGCRDALRAFGDNLLHVLLATCWYATDESCLHVEPWTAGGQTWDAFIGPWTLRGAGEDVVVIPASAMAALKAVFQGGRVVTQLHWLRLVHGFRTDGSTRSEVLLDNELDGGQRRAAAAAKKTGRLKAPRAWVDCQRLIVARPDRRAAP